MTESIHFLRVTLRHVKPVVRRELVVPSDLRLDRLHQVLQAVMGWEDEHLHEFIVGSMRDGEHFGPAAARGTPDFGGPRSRPESRFTLQQIAPHKGSKVLYWYDFGDDWLHEIVVRAVAPAIPGEANLQCMDALGACPPEDCGGPYGYAHLREVLADPAHEDHDAMIEWVGEDFDPSRVEIAAVNTKLASLASRWQRSGRSAKARAR